MNYDREKRVAMAATVAAAKLCEQVRFNCNPAALEKADQSPVTIADFGAQAIVCQALTAVFPGDSIVAEEDATVLRQPVMAAQLALVTEQVRSLLPDATPNLVADWIDRGNGQVSDRFWTLDPIDGTKGFLRGDQYAIALALIEQGEVKVGVLGCPALPIGDGMAECGVLFVAVQGQGTTMIELATGKVQPVQVDAISDRSTWRMTESMEAKHGNLPLQRQIAQAIGLTATPIQMDSQAKYGVVARGDAVLYLRLPWAQMPDYRENIWDHAAGAIVIQEAGGRVTDINGKPLDFTLGTKLTQNLGIVGSNGQLHESVLAALQTFEAAG